MENQNIRKSNIELLRILAIFLVLFSHFSINTTINNVSIDNPLIINDILTRVFSVGGIANHIFIIISGFFLINSSFKINKVFKLVLQMMFYSLLFYLLSLLFLGNSFNIIEFVKSLLPIFFGPWFVIYYIILYLLTPILNKFLNTLDKTHFALTLVTLSILCIIIPTLSTNLWKIDWHFIFIFDYMIGVYINKFVNYKNLNRKKLLIKLLTLSLIVLLLISFTFVIGRILNSDIIINNSHYFIVAPYSFFSVLLAILLFIIFLDVFDFKSKVVNYISSSVLSVYLIHQNFIVDKFLWNSSFLPNDFFVSKWYFILVMILKSIIIFITCICLDKFRIIVFGNIENKLSLLLENVFNNIKEKVLIKIKVYNEEN